jgi:hypothetical protein
MTNQLTARQIEWAKSHDWFVGMLGDCVEVADRFTVNGGPQQEELIRWTGTFAELRNWAGY